MKDNCTHNLIERDNSCVWHPFTPMKQWIEDQTTDGRIIVSGEGFYIEDENGRRYIDGFSSLWCNLHGHRVPAIDNAIKEQLDRIAHTTLLGHASVPSIQLAEKLVEISPDGLDKVFYSDSGATSVEIALKMAYQYYHNRDGKNRTGFIALGDSYHGDTIGSVSLGGISTFHQIFGPLLFETTFVDTPNQYRNKQSGPGGCNVLEKIDRLLTEHQDHFCAVAVEPLVQGAAGILTHPEGFLSGVREITARHGVLMIVDEVATGFCSTGKLFACNHEDVSPDLMCMGKKLTGGYLPLAATLATSEIFDQFCGELSEGRTFYHGHTYTGNALAAAAALASTELIYTSTLLDDLPDKIDLVTMSLSSLREHPNVHDIRHCGMMAGIELGQANGECFNPLDKIGARVCLAMRDRGVIVRPLGDVVVLMPAPGMDRETLGTLLSVVTETINEYFSRN